MEELRLDGNAAAGLLSEVFGRDVTTAVRPKVSVAVTVNE